MHSNDEFLELKGIGDLARKMVETNKDVIYPLVYLLVKLVLALPMDPSYCDCNSGKKFFSNEIYQEWIAQSNEGSVVEWLFDCVH